MTEEKTTHGPHDAGKGSLQRPCNKLAFDRGWVRCHGIKCPSCYGQGCGYCHGGILYDYDLYKTLGGKL